MHPSAYERNTMLLHSFRRLTVAAHFDLSFMGNTESFLIASEVTVTRPHRSVFLEQESPWTVESEDMLHVLRDTDATRLAMAMVQRGVHDADIVSRIFRNLQQHPELDPRTSHILCNILHLVNVDALVDRLFSEHENVTLKRRLRAATTVSKRTRLRTCRNVIQQWRVTP